MVRDSLQEEASLVGTTASIEPTASGTIDTAGTGATYTFSPAVDRCDIQNHPGSGDNLYVLINDTAVNTTKWDKVIEPGDSWEVPQDGISVRIASVNIYCATALVVNTNFVVKGWG